MTYLRLDDKMPEHPKVVRLSDKAFRIHIQGLCYCQRNLTDGIVPRSIGEGWSRKGVAELLQRGLWIERGEDFEIDQFLEWNDSKASVKQKRAKDSARKARGIQSESPRIPEGIPTATDSASALVPVVGSVLSKKESFGKFYGVFPRHEGRGKAEPAFERACRRAEADIIIAGAQRYRDDPNREAGFTALPTTWLNRDGWLDDPLPSRSQSSLRHQDRAREIMKGALSEHAAG